MASNSMPPGPPRYPPQDFRKPMTAPYLADIPKVIPIDQGRQLFVDDFLISKQHPQAFFSTQLACIRRTRSSSLRPPWR